MSRRAIPPPPPPKWVLDLNTPPTPKARPSTALPDPPGYPSTSSSNNNKRSNPSSKTLTSQTTSTTNPVPTAEETDTLKLKKSWDIALAPAKAIPMNAIMMYMSGNSLQIFSIMMVFMLFMNPIKGLLSMNQQFARFETDGTRGRLWAVKGAFVLMQALALGLGVWKVNGMGLLPTTRSDWLAWEGAREPLESAVMGFRKIMA